MFAGIEPFKPADYEPQFETSKSGEKTYTSYWGRGAAIESILGTYAAIPVTVSSTSYGQQGVIPRQVVLTVQYYQVTSGTKRLVTASLSYPLDFQCVALTSGGSIQQKLLGDGIPQCELDSDGAVASSYYLLEVFYDALPWFALLNYFQFTPWIYLLFFLITGVIAILAAAFVWGINRLLTKLRHPPPFHGKTLFQILSFPSVFGIMLSTGPVMIAVVFLWAWFMPASKGGGVCSIDPENSPSVMCLEHILDWTGSEDLDVLRSGRQQLAIIGEEQFFVIDLLLILL